MSPSPPAAHAQGWQPGKGKDLFPFLIPAL